MDFTLSINAPPPDRAYIYYTADKERPALYFSGVLTEQDYTYLAGGDSRLVYDYGLEAHMSSIWRLSLLLVVPDGDIRPILNALTRLQVVHLDGVALQWTPPLAPEEIVRRTHKALLDLPDVGAAARLWGVYFYPTLLSKPRTV